MAYQASEVLIVIGVTNIILIFLITGDISYSTLPLLLLVGPAKVLNYFKFLFLHFNSKIFLFCLELELDYLIYKPKFLPVTPTKMLRNTGVVIHNLGSMGKVNILCTSMFSSLVEQMYCFRN